MADEFSRTIEAWLKKNRDFTSESSAISEAEEIGLFSFFLPDEEGEVGSVSTSLLCSTLAKVCEFDASLGAAVLVQAVAQKVLLSSSPEARVLRGNLAFPAFREFFGGDEKPVHSVCAGETIVDGRIRDVFCPGKAQGFIFSARSSEGVGESILVVPWPGRDSTSMSRVPVETVGLRGIEIFDVHLSGSSARIMGDADRYFRQAEPLAYVALASCFLGLMRGCLEDAISYSRERLQGGRKILAWSEHRMLLAGMDTQVKAAEMLVESAVRATEQGSSREPFAAASALGERLVAFVSDGVQALGGSGYMKDYPQERRFRDALVLSGLFGLGPRSRIRRFTEERDEV